MPELIDKQAVRLLESDADAYTENWNDDYEKGFCDAIYKVLELPTIEAEPVRRGRWIAKLPYDDESVKDLEFQIVCSRCDEQNASINFNDSGEIIGKTFYKTRFCPNCGAKMDLRTPTEAQLDEADSVMMGGADNG